MKHIFYFLLKKSSFLLISTFILWDISYASFIQSPAYEFQADSVLNGKIPGQTDTLHQHFRDSGIIFPTFKYGPVQNWVAQHILYPKDAITNFIQGKVYVQFIVNTDGSVSDPIILRGICPSMDEEAKRVVLSMPKWNPGTQKGKLVRVSYTLPINFTLSR